MMVLFDDTTERIDGPADNNENTYNYFHKSSRRDIGIIRNQLEKWFGQYPDVEKKELKGRFKKDWESAFYELFLYNLFRKLGYEIKIHPKVEGTNKRPDFLISGKDHKIYVEAKVCYDQSEAERAYERKRNQFYDQLNKVRIRGFYLRIVELNFISNKQPKVKELITKIEGSIASYDPGSITGQLMEYGLGACPEITYGNEDFNIIIQPIPVDKPKRQKIIERPIGMFPFETFIGGGEKSLRESILKKAKRYGKFDLPYLICINALGKKTSKGDDMENVIWGTLQYTYSTDPRNRNGRMTRKNDGIFFNGGEKRLRHLSGVLVTKVFSSNIPNASYWFYKNPFANNPLNVDPLDQGYNYVNNENQIISAEGTNLDELLDISKAWLTERN
ncbi:hypothetical protein [Sinomicrobium sp. M5D2P9]